TRFCIIANYTHKLNAPILSRCTRFRFSPLPAEALARRVDHELKEEGVKITDASKDALIRLAKGDMRRALNVLQACFANSTPIKGEGGEQENITEKQIFECVAAPDPEDIRQILDTLLKEEVTTALKTVMDIKTKKGLALADI